MIESILDLQMAVESVLKKLGKFDLCFTEHDLDLLKELRVFLSPFREMTLLVTKLSVHPGDGDKS